MAAKRYEPEEIDRILKEFESIGGKLTDYAQSIGISVHTLRGWQTRKRNGRDPGTVHPGGPYSPAQRKQAVEAYLKSGLTQKDFAATWGINRLTISKWLEAYERGGHKKLESSSFKENPKKRGPKGIAAPLKAEIVTVKQENPNHGLRKIRHFLMRFKGVKVSTGTIDKTLKAQGLTTPPTRRRRRRSSQKVRRFERARAMQLWQSDITSIVLPRHGQRCYLVVFLDDYSRFIVAWNLQLRQTQDLVIEALLSGTERFGKPEEVLTDQGRQYFSWRGKSDFQKLLIKQGIKHVVARSHHPQTVGKCERLWETINQELLERVRPQTLEELRERLTHFFNHYNHFRPHQGIDGMTPADRFFGVESEVRKVLENSFSANELRLAVDEKPRSPVFLIGQIGDKPITMHGEAGRLVVQTPDGEVRQMNYDNFGHTKGEEGHEKRSDGSRSRQEGSQTEKTQRQKETTDTAETSSASAIPLGERDTRATSEGSADRHSDFRDLDGAHHQGGGSQALRNPHPENVAAVTTSDIGYASGTTGTAQDTSQGSDHGSKRESAASTQEDSRIRSNDSKAGHVNCDPAIDAGMQGSASAGANTTTEHSGREECSQDSEEDSSEGTSGSSQ